MGGITVLRGRTGVGRRRVAASAIRSAGLIPVSGDRSIPELRLLSRLRLACAIVHAPDLENLGWTSEDGTLLAWASPSEALPAGDVVDIPGPDHNERARCWRAALDNAEFSGDAESLAVSLAWRFTFTEGEIERAMSHATHAAEFAHRRLDRQIVWDSARRQPEHALERVAALLRPTCTFDDLLISEDTEAQLRQIVAHV